MYSYIKRVPLLALFYLLMGLVISNLPVKADESTHISYPTVAIENVDIFPVAGAEPYKRDLKNLEYHLIDTGHFALETHGRKIAGLINNFLNRKVESPSVAAK